MINFLIKEFRMEFSSRSFTSSSWMLFCVVSVFLLVPFSYSRIVGGTSMDKIFSLNGIFDGFLRILAFTGMSPNIFNAVGTLISDLKGLLVVWSGIVGGAFSLKISSSNPGALSPYFARKVVLCGCSVVILKKELDGFNFEFRRACGKEIGRLVSCFLLKNVGNGLTWSEPTPCDNHTHLN